MFEFFTILVAYTVPVFVIFTMLNVGLTQRLSEIVQHLSNRRFVLKMLVANFVAAPLFMYVMLYFAPFDPALKTGLFLFGLCAGAPFLIKLTQTAEHDIALGAAVMMLLMMATVVYVPIVLPLVLQGLNVDAWAIATTLVTQMLLPVAAGMLFVQFLPDLASKMQPWAGWIGNVALYVVIGATMIGYLPSMLGIVGTGAIFIGLAFSLGAFGMGYLTGAGKDHLEDVGGLGTAQRNNAAGMIIATQNFADHPDVMVMLTLANTLGIVMLFFIAKRLSRDNRIETETV